MTQTLRGQLDAISAAPDRRNRLWVGALWFTGLVVTVCREVRPPHRRVNARWTLSGRSNGANGEHPALGHFVPVCVAELFRSSIRSPDLESHTGSLP